MIILKSADEIAIMRKAGAIVAEVMARLKESVSPGITTLDLDKIAQTWIKKLGAKPTFVGYMGYPKSLCVSINEEVVHGIPGKRLINSGDVVSIDCGVTFNGFVADHAETVIVGSVDTQTEALVNDTKRSLEIGIDVVKIDSRIGDIGHAIQSFAESKNYGVVRDFVGHGIGRRMHEEPQIPNFGRHGSGPRIQAGMVLALEPMLNLGTPDVKILKDGWTVVTKDGKCSAHFEHTVAVTQTGVQLLTVV